MTRRILLWIGLALLTCLAPAATGGAQEETAAAADKVAAAREAEKAEAMDVLRRASGFLAQQARFAFTYETAFDVVQPTGLALEFGATSRATVRRPDRVRVESRQRPGDRRLLLFDGENLTVSLPDDAAYATVAHPGPLHAAVDYLVDGLDTPTPLADLLHPEFLDASLEASIRHAFVVAEEEVEGSPCTHVAVRGNGVDAQFWIEDGERPLLRRLVITYTEARGSPSFRASLRDWDLAPDVSEALFRFEPPEGAERIPFAPRPAPIEEGL